MILTYIENRQDSLDRVGFRSSDLAKPDNGEKSVQKSEISIKNPRKLAVLFRNSVENFNLEE